MLIQRSMTSKGLSQAGMQTFAYAGLSKCMSDASQRMQHAYQIGKHRRAREADIISPRCQGEGIAEINIDASSFFNMKD